MSSESSGLVSDVSAIDSMFLTAAGPKGGADLLTEGSTKGTVLVRGGRTAVELSPFGKEAASDLTNEDRINLNGD